MNRVDQLEKIQTNARELFAKKTRIMETHLLNMAQLV